MTKYAGKSFLVKMGNGDGPPETFTTVANMKTTSMNLGNGPIDTTDKDGMPWKNLVSGGVKSMSISLAGFFSDAAVLATLVGKIMDGATGTDICNFRLTSARGDKFEGPFFIASLDRSGNHDGAEEYSMKLDSAGTIVYTAAP